MVEVFEETTRDDHEVLFEVAPEYVYTIQDFQKYLTLVLSRYMTFQGRTFLAPVLDLINFHYLGNVKWTKDPARKGIVVQAKEKISPEDQIFIELGKMSNMELLNHYGFVLENNPENQYPVDISFDP